MAKPKEGKVNCTGGRDTGRLPFEIAISNAVDTTNSSNERYKPGDIETTELGCIGATRGIFISIRATVLYKKNPYPLNLYSGKFFELRIRKQPDGPIELKYPITSEEPIPWEPNTWAEVAFRFPKGLRYQDTGVDWDLLRPNRLSKSASIATILRR
jgi:hypothetical protein